MLALLEPWGKGLEAGLPCVSGGTGEWPRKITVLYPKWLEYKSILLGSFVLSLWPENVPPIVLHINPSVTPTGRRVKVFYARPGQDLSHALSFPRTNLLHASYLMDKICLWCH